MVVLKMVNARDIIEIDGVKVAVGKPENKGGQADVQCNCQQVSVRVVSLLVLKFVHDLYT